MPTLNVKLDDQLTPTQRELLAQVKGPGMIRAASEGVAEKLRAWFAGFEQTRPNKEGYPRQHFWSAVRDTVQNPQVNNPEVATVSITHRAIRQRLEGGYIRPTGGKQYLTIPARAEAYGHVAREFHNLHFGFAQNRYGNLAPALIENLAQKFSYGRKRKDGTKPIKPGDVVGGGVFYWLVRKAFQPADSSVLPTQAEMETAATSGALEFAQATTDRLQGGAA